MKNVAANIKDHHLEKNVYLQIISIGLSDLMWKIFATIMYLTNEKNLKNELFADPVLVTINCDLRLPQDIKTYLNDIIWFSCVDEFVYVGKALYFVDAYVCKSKIMLPP